LQVENGHSQLSGFCRVTPRLMHFFSVFHRPNNAHANCPEPNQAPVIHWFLVAAGVPGALSTRTVGIIAARAVSPRLFEELWAGDEPGIHARGARQEDEFKRLREECGFGWNWLGECLLGGAHVLRPSLPVCIDSVGFMRGLKPSPPAGTSLAGACRAPRPDLNLCGSTQE
jgi:hypothetical protein